jgi:hypothetical protein
MNWIFFYCFIWLYEVCIVCIGSKYMHINTHTVFYWIFMYVCVFICMYVYVFFASKPVGESILTHTYIYMHIHTNFQKKYVHIKQKYISYTYQIQTFQTRTLLFYFKTSCHILYVFVCILYVLQNT